MRSIIAASTRIPTGKWSAPPARLCGDAGARTLANQRTGTLEVVRGDPDAEADHVSKAAREPSPALLAGSLLRFSRVWSEAKRIEKLCYIHRNPVKRGLAERPEDWKWSSFVHYATGMEGTVEIESQWTARRREQMGVALVVRAHPFGAVRLLRASSPAKNAGRVGQPRKEA